MLELENGIKIEWDTKENEDDFYNKIKTKGIKVVRK